METEFIKKTIKVLLNKFDIEFEIETIEDKDINTTRFLVKTTESNILIGYKGANLAALSHVVKRIVDKEFNGKEDRMCFILDVNNYQGNKIKELKTNAHMLAERAKYFKSSVEMNPLPPYERMIIHSLFAQMSDFETKSQGEGEKRRVFIQYIGE